MRNWEQIVLNQVFASYSLSTKFATIDSNSIYIDNNWNVSNYLYKNHIFNWYCSSICYKNEGLRRGTKIDDSMSNHLLSRTILSFQIELSLNLYPIINSFVEAGNIYRITVQYGVGAMFSTFKNLTPEFLQLRGSIHTCFIIWSRFLRSIILTWTRSVHLYL